MNFEVSNILELLGKRTVDITVSMSRNVWVDRANHKQIIFNDFVVAEELVVELSNIQKIIQILNSNEAKTWVHNND